MKKRSLRRVFLLLFSLMLLWLFYIIKFFMVDASYLVTNSYNPRLAIMDEKIQKGAIKDRHGEVLVENGPNRKRIYRYPKIFSHVLGYTSAGRYGLEAKESMHLQSLHHEVTQRIRQAIFKSDLLGNDVVSTLDASLQKKAYQLIGKQKGAIVLMEANTGKILTMVSTPSFDSNELSKNFDRLKDSDQKELYNKASQGLYAPGSVFKLVMLISLLENHPEPEKIIYECTGNFIVGDTSLKCVSGAHGTVDFEKALIVSCNGYFANLMHHLDFTQVLQTAEVLGFNHSLSYPLEYSQSSFPWIPLQNKKLLADSYIGQGKILSTPLHFAMIASAISNNGKMMMPYLVDKICDPEGKTLKQHLPQLLRVAISEQTAATVKQLMIEAVKHGTARTAFSKAVVLGAKTGTAEVENQKSHSWFVAFAEKDKSPIVCVVFLENGGFGSNGGYIAKTLLEKAIELQG